MDGPAGVIGQRRVQVGPGEVDVEVLRDLVQPVLGDDPLVEGAASGFTPCGDFCCRVRAETDAR